MRINRRTVQGGSIASFISVGIVITLIFVGSFYYLKTHGDQVRKDQAIAKADSDKLTSQPSDNSSDPTDTDSSVNPAEENEVTIPTTGPEMMVGKLIGAGALAVSVAGFVTSKRQRARYL